MPDPGERYTWAALADRFGLTPDQIGSLTDWQLAHVYFHPRDKDGILVPPSATTAEPKQPEAPRVVTPEMQLAEIDGLELMKLIAPANADACRAKIRAKMGQK